jgi:hypothetical protein
MISPSGRRAPLGASTTPWPKISVDAQVAGGVAFGFASVGRTVVQSATAISVLSALRLDQIPVYSLVGESMGGSHEQA